jgi:lipopolysaccharide transport system permease protein
MFMSTGENQIVEYTPASDLRYPGKLGRRMFKDLTNSLELAYFLFVRNLSSQYRQSYLGFFWAVIPMLVTAGAFIMLHSEGIFHTAPTQIPYPLFVMMGILLWHTFLDSIQTLLRTLETSRPMLMKINFPREALLVSSLYEIFFNAGLRGILILVAAMLFGISFSAGSLLSIFGLISLIGLGFSISLFFAPFALLYQDLGRALNVFSLFWMMATPVLYPLGHEGFVMKLIHWNPVSPVLKATRDWLTLGDISNLKNFMVVTFLWIVLIPLGWIFYRICLKHTISRMGM